MDDGSPPPQSPSHVSESASDTPQLPLSLLQPSPQQQPPAPRPREEEGAQYSWLFVPLLSFALENAPMHRDIDRVIRVPGAWLLLHDAAGVVQHGPQPNPPLVWTTSCPGRPYLSEHQQQRALAETMSSAEVQRLLFSARAFTSLGEWLNSFPSEDEQLLEDPSPELPASALDPGAYIPQYFPWPVSLIPPIRSLVADPSQVICPICIEAISRGHVLPCSHALCVQCFAQWRNGDDCRCPLCRASPPTARVSHLQVELLSPPEAGGIAAASVLHRLLPPRSSSAIRAAPRVCRHPRSTASAPPRPNADPWPPTPEALVLPDQHEVTPSIQASPTPASVALSPRPHSECTCQRRRGVQGRHRMTCPCSISFAANEESRRLQIQNQAEAAARQNSRFDEVLASQGFPSLSIAARVYVPTVLAIPRGSRALWNEVCSKTLESDGLLALHQIAAKCCLAVPSRGGANVNLTRIINSCCHRFLSGEVTQLWQNCVTRSARFARREAVNRAVTAERLARCGFLSKAMRRLKGAPIAPNNASTLESLHALHPQSSEEGVADLPPLVPLPNADFSLDSIDSALKSFAPGSASGPSGFRSSHYLAAFRHGGRFPHLFQRLLQRFADGAFASSQPVGRFYLWSASLFALSKQSGAIRPIACGEVIRRLCGKLLSTKHGPEYLPYFLAHHQYAIGTKGGIEAALHASRQVGQSLPPRHVIVKFDFSNAFNRFLREIMLKQSQLHTPAFSRYLTAAYQQWSALYFSDEIIRSMLGSQQGDPLGGVAFALVAAEADSQLDPSWWRLWIMDDLLLRCPIGEILRLLEIVEGWASEFGLHLNWSKVQIITDEAVDAELSSLFLHLAQPVNFSKVDEAEFLGCTLSSRPEVISAFLEHAVDEMIGTLHLVNEIAFSPLVATNLLIQCAAFPAAGYLLRVCGQHSAWSRFDDAARSVLSSITSTPFDQTVLFEVSLSNRNGGVGLRSTEKYAPIAHAASLASTWDLQATILAPLGLAPSQQLLAVTSSSGVFRDELLSTELLSREELSNQKALSKRVDDTQHDRLLQQFRDSDDRHKLICAMSRSSQGAMSFLRCSYGLKPLQFCLLFRRLFRIQLAEALWCPFCLQECDAFGDHVSLCRVHNNEPARLSASVCSTLLSIAREAALAPVPQPRPFDSAFRDVRADVSLPFFAGSRDCIIDVAVVNPFATSNAAAAASEPAGAAVRYEDQKRRHYAPMLVPSRHLLVPFVLDSLCGFGPEASSFLSSLAGFWGARLEHPHGEATAMLRRRVSICVAAQTSSLLLAAAEHSSAVECAAQQESSLGVPLLCSQA